MTNYTTVFMHKIVFATNNSNKLKEVQHLLGNKYTIIGLAELGFTGDIPETGKTLYENASIKSRFVNEKFGEDCFSDDTGLEIESLDGRPGVYSARYAGEPGDADKNIDKVLRELRNKQNRNARFRTVISLVMGDKEHFFEGEVRGRIIDERRGEDGFGYDPVFIPDGYDQTFAEMDIKEKNIISHRSKAVQKLIEFLKNYD